MAMTLEEMLSKFYPRLLSGAVIRAKNNASNIELHGALCGPSIGDNNF